jgi:hypothetical protein
MGKMALTAFPSIRRQSSTRITTTGLINDQALLFEFNLFLRAKGNLLQMEYMPQAMLIKGYKQSGA